jgi:hypothetical protein
MIATTRMLAALLLAVGLAACSEHDTKTAERSVSPLVGTWTRDGDSTSSDADGPHFTKLAFAADGSLTAHYVGGGHLASAIGAAPPIKTERDTYTTPDAKTLSVAEGTRHLAYQYHVSDAKLYLTPSGGGDAAVFTKSEDS